MLEYMVSGAISGVTVLIGLYVILKSNVFHDRIIEIMTTFVIEVGNNEEIQKSMYIIGGLLANGVKGGVGLKSGGKTKPMDLIISMLVEKFVPTVMAENQKAVL